LDAKIIILLGTLFYFSFFCNDAEPHKCFAAPVPDPITNLYAAPAVSVLLKINKTSLPSDLL
jgi:hypothetical protein